MNIPQNNIDNFEEKFSRSIFLIEVEKIKPNPMQPRREFDPEALANLSESIRQYGILQPLVVTRRETEVETGTLVEYELISGERRLRASKLAGLLQVPVIIRNEHGNKMKLELAIIENLQREDLNAMERAEAFQKLAEDFDLRHHEIANRVGKSRVFVTNTIRLLTLPEDMKEALRRGDISEGHCRPLLMLVERPHEQLALFQEMLDRKMTVREAERISRNIAVERSKNHGKESPIELQAREVAKELADFLGTRVLVEALGDKGGRILIDFFSPEEMRSFLNRVKLGGKESILDEEVDLTEENKNESQEENKGPDYLTSFSL